MLQYDPKLNEHTGGIEETIFFLQMLYWWNKMEKPFYKFQSPCEHQLYKSGESWQEELGLSSHKLKRCKNIVMSKLELRKTYSAIDLKLILYWAGGNNMTFYFPNLVQMLMLPDEIKELLEKQFPNFRKWKTDFLKYESPISEIQFSPSRNAKFKLPYKQENTQKNNQKNKTGEPPTNFSLENFEKRNGEEKENEMVFPFESESFTTLWTEWKRYKESNFNFKYNSSSEQSAFFLLVKYNEEFASQLLINAMANNWKNFHFEETPSKFKNFLKSQSHGTVTTNSGEEFEQHAAKFFQKYNS